ncbi:MAG TPA: hypothetical protein VMV27_00570 [Candidatus Binataceae bacterium]|nr:hypothetical protein [Candidatus Binataceae bacterium]
MKRHPLERRWNTTAWDILSAIEHGFRAQVDVKGKLAEFYLFRELRALTADAAVRDLVWQDNDGQPDFQISYRGRPVRIECKNVRSPIKAREKPVSAKVELQKTRNSKAGEPTRGYKCDEFEILSACLFNYTGKWEYLFIATRNLELRPAPMDRFLKIMQPVPLHEAEQWRSNLLAALQDASG